MSFFTLSDGSKATGSEDRAHFQGFRIIPNNSKILAYLAEIKKNNGQKAPYYEISWVVYQGEYKDNKVTQRLFPWAQNEKASDRAKEMLFRIFKCCGVLPPELEPTQYELAQLQGKVCGIKVKEEEYQDQKGQWKEKNDVIEVHPARDFQEEIGEKMIFKREKLETSELNPPPFKDDDIPFF